MNIPDAAIEAASVELAVMCKQKPSRFYRNEARAAIEAAMPAIREHIAQLIEADTNGDPYIFGKRLAARIVRGGAA